MTSAITTASGLEATVLEVASLDAAGRAAWDDLADRAVEPNPFMRPEFVLANMVHRRVRSRLMVVRDPTRWVACLPVRPSSPTRRLPLPHLEGLTDDYSLLGTPLVDRDAVVPAADAFIEMVRAERRAAVVVLERTAADGPVGAALMAAATRRGVRPAVVRDFERAAWRRAADGSPSGASLKASDRRELHRRSKLLARELGGEPEVVDRSAEPEAWDAFLAMENSGWKSGRGTALASKASDASFFRQMCADMAAGGLLELVALEVGGRTIAMECHLVDGDALFSFKIAHEPEFRRFSPGTQLKYRVIEGLHQRGLALADSCAATDNAHMNRLWPDRRRMQTVLLPTGARSAHLVHPGLRAQAVVQRVRERRARPPAASGP